MNVIERITASNRTNIIVGIILIVAIIGIIVLSIQAYVKANSDEDTLNLLQQQLTTLKSNVSTTETKLNTLSAQFDDAEGHIASSDYEQDSDIDVLQEGLTAANNEISSINSQISSILSQISGLQAEDISDNSQISSIRAQLTSLTSQLSSVSNTTASLQTSLTSLERTVATLSSIVNSINYPFTNPATLFTSKSISQVAGSQTVVYTFTPTISGYVYITGNSSSSTGYIRIADNSTSATQAYAFGTANNLSIPLTAGHNYSILFGNSATSGTVTAVLTGSYYY
jgi:peptidoglycan hydrolase CwlO-like protein